MIRQKQIQWMKEKLGLSNQNLEATMGKINLHDRYQMEKQINPGNE